MFVFGHNDASSSLCRKTHKDFKAKQSGLPDRAKVIKTSVKASSDQKERSKQ
jgi:hypothetical protein